MRKGINISILILCIFLINGCPTNHRSIPSCNISCGPLDIVTAAQTNTGYAIGYNQLLNINSTGNTIFTLSLPGIGSGLWIDTMDVSVKTNTLWAASNAGSGSNVLTILNSSGLLFTQAVTNIPTITSVKLSKITDIGWITGFSSTGTATLEALTASGTSLVSFTIPSLLSPSAEPIKLAISPVDDTVWIWSKNELSGFTLTGIKLGPYPVNLSETIDASYRKQIIVNPTTGDIWIGSPTTSTVIVYYTNGIIRFQKDIGINVFTMAASPKTGNVWIGDLNKIEVLNSSGNIVNQFSFNDINDITSISISPIDNNVWIGNAIKLGTQDSNLFILSESGTILHAYHIGINCNACI